MLARIDPASGTTNFCRKFRQQFGAPDLPYYIHLHVMRGEHKPAEQRWRRPIRQDQAPRNGIRRIRTSSSVARSWCWLNSGAPSIAAGLSALTNLFKLRLSGGSNEKIQSVNNKSGVPTTRMITYYVKHRDWSNSAE